MPFQKDDNSYYYNINKNTFFASLAQFAVKYAACLIVDIKDLEELYIVSIAGIKGQLHLKTKSAGLPLRISNKS